MKDKNFFLSGWVPAIGAALVIICLSVSLTVMFRPLYYFDIEHLQISEISGYTPQECRENYDALIDYNLLFGDKELVFPDMDMSREGRIHFEEVKDIFISMQIISAAGLAALAAWVIRIRKNGAGRNRIIWMKYTGYVILTVIILAAGAMVIDWQWAFETMHDIFFDNDYWIFDPDTDPVITILPDMFFYHCGILIVILAAVQIAALQLTYRRLAHGRRKKL